MLHAPEEAKRIYDKGTAEALKTQAAKASAPLSVKKTLEKESPALPYSLPMLQKDANKNLGFTASKTLKIAQSLYEKKVTTYPRTDCQYLTESQIPEVGPVLASVARVYPTQVETLKSLGVITRASTFDGTKLVDHHAIIPTIVQVELDADEKALYGLICQRYLRALAPDHEFTSTNVTLYANGVLFKASGRTPIKPGWKALKLIGDAAESAE